MFIINCMANGLQVDLAINAILKDKSFLVAL